MKNKLENKNYWLENPLEFAQNRIDSRQYILLPKIASLIEDEKFSSILDYGCGEGFLSNNFKNKQIRLGLFDISEEMVSLAEKQSKNNEISNFISFRNPSDIPAQSFDCVVLSLVLMTIGNDSDYLNVLFNCNKALVKTGSLYIGLTHPCFRNTLFSTHHTNFSLGEEYSYFEESKPFDVFLRTSKSESYIHFQDFHHSLTYTFSKIIEAGFYVDGLIELKDDSVENSFYNKKFSPYLIIKCKIK